MLNLPRETRGTGSARALLVHGLSSNRHTWWQVSDALLAAGWQTTAVDLRGHGEAERADSYALEHYASDLPREDWDLVVAHSLGGAAAVIAASEPGFARRLALLDPVLEVREQDYEAIVAEQVAELDLGEHELRAAKPHWHETDVAAKIGALGQVHPPAVSRSFSDSHPWNIVEVARALTMPTLILGGDPAVYTMLDPRAADELAASNPLVTYRVVPEAGHSPHRDRPEQTLAALFAWLG